MNPQIEKLKKELVVIQDATTISNFLASLTDHEREVVFTSLKEKLCWPIDYNGDTSNIIKFINTQHLRTEQRNITYSELEKEFSWIIKNGHDFGVILKFLSPEQRTIVYDGLNKNENRWEQIVQNGKDLEAFFDYLDFKQQLDLCRICKERLNSFIYAASNENETIYVYFDGFFYDSSGDDFINILRSVESIESEEYIFLNRLPKNSVVLDFIVENYIHFLTEDNLRPWQDVGNRNLQIKILEFILASEVAYSYLTSHLLDKITSHCQSDDTERYWDYISDREMIENLLEHAKKNERFCSKIESNLFCKWAQYIRHSSYDDPMLLHIPEMILSTPSFISRINIQDLQKLKSIYQSPEKNSPLDWYCTEKQLKKLEVKVDEQINKSSRIGLFFQSANENIDNETLADLAQLQISAKQI